MKLTKSQSAKLRSAIQITIGGHLVAAAYATYEGNEKWYSRVIMPMLRLLGAETAHRMAITCAKYGIVPRAPAETNANLATEVWGRHFANPIGLAAGFDKNGEAVNGLLNMGFGFVEVGSVTPKPQAGNDRPRMFRLNQDRAMINRCGFNNDGHEVVHKRLKSRVSTVLGRVIPDERNFLNENLPSPDMPTVQGRSNPACGIVGVNLGKNKTSEDATTDYVTGIRTFGDVADYLVINVSSPNTPGLRKLQGREQLASLIDKVLEERDKLAHKPPLLVKISPDLTEQDKVDIASVVTRKQRVVDGLVISNTTVSRPTTLMSGEKDEVGGLSGRPLTELSNQMIRDMYRLTDGRIAIVGVGGVASGSDAMDKLKAGASLVQLYTSLGYEGPPLVRRVVNELAQLLRDEGFSCISEAVGADFLEKRAK